MLLGIVYMMAALSVFIMIGASTAGLALIAPGTPGNAVFFNFAASGVLLFLTGLGIATNNKYMCGFFSGAYLGSTANVLFAGLNLVSNMGTGIFMSGFSSAIFLDYCS